MAHSKAIDRTIHLYWDRVRSPIRPAHHKHLVQRQGKQRASGPAGTEDPKLRRGYKEAKQLGACRDHARFVLQPQEGILQGVEVVRVSDLWRRIHLPARSFQPEGARGNLIQGPNQDVDDSHPCVRAADVALPIPLTGLNVK